MLDPPQLPLIDLFSRALVDNRFPERLRERALGLPWEIGISRSPEGGFADYAASLPMQELPLFAADGVGVGGAQPSEETLERFRLAHYCGGYHGLVADRLADGQIEADAGLLEIRDLLYESWVESLESVLPDKGVARPAVVESMRRLDSAVRLERDSLSQGRMSLEDYGQSVADKVHWLGLPSRLLVEVHAGEARGQQFQRCFDLLMLALQCCDDARDVDEDARTRGGSIPECLGFPSGALMRAGIKLFLSSAQLARQLEFNALSGWAHVRWIDTRALLPDGDRALIELGSEVIVATLLDWERARSTPVSSDGAVVKRV